MKGITKRVGRKSSGPVKKRDGLMHVSDGCVCVCVYVCVSCVCVCVCVCESL